MIKRSPAGESAVGSQSTSKSTCVVPAWTLTSENEPFSTAERSERVENFLFRTTREYTEAGIEQAIVAERRLGTNSPEPRKRAVHEWHVSTQKTGRYITERSRLPELIVGPCPSEESLCCPACKKIEPLQLVLGLFCFQWTELCVISACLSVPLVGLLAPSDRSCCAVQLVFSSFGCPFPFLIQPL